MEISGEETVVYCVEGRHGTRYFNPDMVEYTSPAVLKEIRRQRDDEHKIGIADLYGMIKSSVSGGVTEEELDEAIKGISVPTKVGELENDAGYATAEEALLRAKVYDMGDFETLDELSARAADHGFYNGTGRVLLYFTVAGADMGLIINNMGDMEDGYPYTARQYMYYKEHRYTRTVRRSQGGTVSYTAWVVEDNVTLSGKGVDFSKLASLTEDATDAEVREALTYPNGEGVVTADDLAACEEKGMFLRECNTNAQLAVGRTLSGSHYTITYVGYPVSGTSVDTTRPAMVQSVVIAISGGTYSVVKAATVDDVLTTGWEKYPLEVKIPLWGSGPGGRVYSGDTILGWFGCGSVSELKSRAKSTGLMSLLYLNSGDMHYRIPVQFIEFKDGDNQIHIVTVGLDMADDSPCRYEVVINMDGTLVTETSNVSLVKETLAKVSELEALETEIENIKIRLALLEG